MSVKLHTTGGLIQHYANLQDVLKDKNRNGKVYELRETNTGWDLFHKGHQRRYGWIDREKKTNPKRKRVKGVMPPALKRYWETHRRGKKGKKVAKRKRARNPSGTFKLIAKKTGRNSLTFNGVKFASGHVVPVYFPSIHAAQQMAQRMVRKHKVLRSYEFFAVPR